MKIVLRKKKLILRIASNLVGHKLRPSPGMSYNAYETVNVNVLLHLCVGSVILSLCQNPRLSVSK